MVFFFMPNLRSGQAPAFGRPEGYHETLTRFWLLRIARAMAETPSAEDGEALLEAHPDLGNKRLCLRHYRQETLESDAARQGWVAPDVEPIP